MAKQDWGTEYKAYRRLGSKLVVLRADGTESPRMLVTDVLSRVWAFQTGGVYTIRDGDTVVYVGMTSQPLGVRFRMARAMRVKWTMQDYSAWTVTLRRGEEEVEDALIAEHRPKFNIVGGVKAYPRRGRELLLVEAAYLRAHGKEAAAAAIDSIIANYFSD